MNERRRLATYCIPEGGDLPVEVLDAHSGLVMVRVLKAWDRFKEGARFECPTMRLTGNRWVTPPYGEMCRNPAQCEGKGYCPRDPTCGD